MIHTLMPALREPQMLLRHRPRRREIHIQLPLDHHYTADLSVLWYRSHGNLLILLLICLQEKPLFIVSNVHIHLSIAAITHTTIPSHVINIVQLKPSIDINPKFLCFVSTQTIIHIIICVHSPSKRDAFPNELDSRHPAPYLTRDQLPACRTGALPSSLETS